MLVSVGSFLLKAFLQDPHGIWDVVDTWNYRARWLFRGGPHWSYAFSLRAKDGLDYPLLVTASVFRMWQILGKDPIGIPILIAGIFGLFNGDPIVLPNRKTLDDNHRR